MMPFSLLAAPLLLFAEPSSASSTANASSASPAVDAPQPPPAAPALEAPRTALNSVFFEALGSGLLYSVNYERIIDKWNVGLRAGVSYFTYKVSDYGSSGNLTLVSIPFVASYYYGVRAHNLQLGVGATILYTGVATDSQGTKFEDERSGAGLAATAVIGYRYIPRDGGITFGAGFTPLLRTTKFLPWGGANVGYAF